MSLDDHGCLCLSGYKSSQRRLIILGLLGTLIDFDSFKVRTCMG